LSAEPIQGEGIEVVELYAGGIRLLDMLSGWERAILVDAMVSGQRSPGDWVSFSLEDETAEARIIPVMRNASSTHDLSFPMVLAMGRTLGMPMPSQIQVWGVEAADVETFSEKPTDSVARAIAPVAEEVINTCMSLPWRNPL
jgi:hydrogenase maturation protease